MRLPKTSSTLTDVAREAGVSIATASLVLNSGKPTRRVSPPCAERVRQAAERLGYVPNYHARSMKGARSDMVGVVLDVDYRANRDFSELATTYHGSLAAAVELHARLAGYHLSVVGPIRELRAIDRAVAALRERRFAGLVVPAQTASRKGHIERLEALYPAPIVLIEHRAPSPLPVVDWDERAGIALGVRHLAGLGHREILWLGPEWMPAAGRIAPSVPDAREQLLMGEAWDAGMRGRSCRFGQVRGDETRNPLMTVIAAADEALSRHLAERPRDWTAVVAWNDAVAIGACRALGRAGLRIPQDVSVLGFDDVEARLGVPALTSVSHAFADLGRRATELLVEMVEDPAACERRRGHREDLVPALAVRESTGPAAPVPSP